MKILPIHWILIFIFSLIVDISLIIIVTIYKLDIILYIMILIAFLGSYVLLTMWNEDERTDTAIDEASREVIKIFGLIVAFVGVILTILGQNNNNLRIIGITLDVSFLVLVFLQAVMSIRYADQMS